MIKIDNHKIISDLCTFMPSPNCDDRPDEKDISLLVIHNITLPPGVFGKTFVEDFFLNQLDISEHEFFDEIKDLRVSSHLYIKRTGEMVQFAEFNKRAWHAGVSSYGERTSCNDFSIGIELEGTDEEPYTEKQYAVLTEVTLALMENYPQINQKRIVGHSDIAPGRKTDPGQSFDWQVYLSNIRENQ